MSVKFGSIPSITGVCLAVIFIAGCAGLETQINSLSFHEGQAETNEQILLRNIIAAAHDKAPTFVAAQTVTSSSDLTGMLSAQFQDLVVQGHTLSPSLSAKRAQSVNLVDYGATKAAQHLYVSVPHDTIRELLIQGWPSRLIETVLEAIIVISEELDYEIRSKADEVCDKTDDSFQRALCHRNKDIISRCPDPVPFAPAEVLAERSDYWDSAPYGKYPDVFAGRNVKDKVSKVSTAPHAYFNDPRDECKFRRFQLLRNRMDLTGTNLRVADLPVTTKSKTIEAIIDPKTGGIIEKTTETEKPIIEKGRPVVEKRLTEVFNDPDIDAKFKLLKENIGEGEGPILAVFLRSPAQIVEFVGRLVALQLFGEPPTVVTVPIEVGGTVEWVAPFRVVRGRDLDGPSAVSVRFGTFGRYHVPESEALGGRGHQSMRVMAFIIEMQNRARQEAPIQGATIAIVQ